MLNLQLRPGLGNVVFRALAVLLVALPARGATTVARLETTAQQAVLRLTTDQPAAAPCSIRVSLVNQFAAGYQPVHDVNQNLFKNSDQCSRPGNVRDGNTFTFVLGQRTAEIANDHLRYSRSLQAATTYFYQIQLGADTVTGQFTTTTILTGNTYNDSRVDPARPGEYLYPSIDWADKNKTYVDPFTGALLKRAGSPGDIGASVTEEPIGQLRQLGSSWQIQSPAQKAASSGTAQGKLFLPAQSWKPGPSDIRAVDFVQLNVKLSGTAAAVCLTLDAVHCAGGTIRQTIAPDNGKTEDRKLTFGTNVPVLRAWQDGPTPPAYRDDVRVLQGSAVLDSPTANDRRIIRWASGEYFNIHWAPGSRIKLAAPNTNPSPPADCEIASVNSDKELSVIAGTCSPPSGIVSFSGSNFGFLLWNPDPAGSALHVAEPTWTLGISGFASEWAAGYVNLCSPLPTPGPEHQQGSICGAGPGYAQYQITTPLYWFGTDGQSVVLGGMSVPHNSRYNGSCESTGVVWDGNQPATYYCLGSVAKGPTVLFAVRYKGNYQNSPVTDANELRSDVNLLSGNIDQAASAFETAYKGFSEGTQYGWNLLGWQPYGQKGALLLKRNWDIQNSPGWWMVFDLNTNSVSAMLCSYCGGPGAINRWIGIHSTSAAYGVPWAISTVATLEYGSSVAATSGTPMLPVAPYLSCPADSFDPSVAGKPSCSGPIPIPSLTPTDRNNRNLFRQTWQAGDYAEVFDGDRDTYERVRLMKIDASGGQASLILQRCVRNFMYPNCGAHPGNLRLVASPGAFVEFWWNWVANPHGTSSTGTEHTLAEDPDSSGCHYVYAMEMFVVGCPKIHPKDAQGRELPGTPVRMGALPANLDAKFVLVNTDGPFAAHAHILSGTFNEMHPSHTQYRSPDKDTFLSMRPYLGDAALANNVVKIGQYLYRIRPDPAAGLEYRKLPLIVMAGDIPVADVSPSLIKDVREDAYKACYVVIPGNCYAGSQPGEIYLNAPFVSQTSTFGNRFDNSPPMDISITQSSSTNSMQEARVIDRHDPEGHFVRRITTALAPARMQSVYWNAHALPDNSWAFFLGYRMDRVRNELMLVKLPPMPDPNDPVKRNDFQPVQVTVPAHADGASVRAVFGYAENGDTGAGFCTSRQVACTTAVAPAEKATKPFVWLDEAQTALSCRTGCKLSIPALPGHVVYYKLEWLNANAQVVGYGPLTAVAVP